MNYLLLAFVAILPIIIICFLVYIKDSEREPFLLLLKLFGCGILSVFLVYMFTFFLQHCFSFFRVMPPSNSFFKLFVYIFILIATIEEISKFIMVFVFGYNDKNFDQAYDIIIYTVFVSLGFAAFENILYVFQNGLSNAIIRGFTAVPIHACYGIFMGYYLALAKISKRNKNKKLFIKNIFLSIMTPIFMHTLYDYLIFLNDPFFSLTLIVTIIVMYYFAVLRLVQIANLHDSRI